MLLLRNLVYNSQTDIDQVLAWSGSRLLAVARGALEHERASSQVCARGSRPTARERARVLPPPPKHLPHPNSHSRS